MNKDDQVLTPDDVAKELQIHLQTARALLRESGSPAFKLGRAVRVVRGELMAWLMKRREKSQAMSAEKRRKIWGKKQAQPMQ
jgi:excisionase family DNA binding protein